MFRRDYLSDKMSDIITLKCVVLGCSLYNIFSVDISRSGTAKTLMEAIKASKPGWHIENANDLTLFRIANAVEFTDYSDLPQKLELSEEGPSGLIRVPCHRAAQPHAIYGIKLEPQHSLTLSDYLPTGGLRVIVRLPQTRKLVPDGATLSLNCIFFGDPLSDIFAVRVSSNDSVSTLRDAIMNSHLPRNVAAKSLFLWAVFFSEDDLHTKLYNFSPSPGTALKPMKRLSTIFEVVLDPDQLHVILSPSDLMPTD